MENRFLICDRNFNIKLYLNHGISLITLVITIVVVIILAAAIVMSLNNNNIIINSGNARYTTDLNTMQSYLEFAIHNATIRYQGTFKLETGRIETDETSNVKETRRDH